MRRFAIIMAANMILTGIATSDATAGLFSGTIKSVDPDRGRITVDVTGSRARNFDVPGTARIELDGARAGVDELAEGQRVSIFTDAAGIVTRVRVRSGSPRRPTTPRETPEPDPESVPSEDAPDVAVTTGADDGIAWFQFRGPGRRNQSQEAGLARSWPSGGPPLTGTIDGLGVGYAAVSLTNGRILTMGSRGQDEFVICLDDATGEEVWATRTGRSFRNGQGNGPRGTPTIDGDRVYALGANGDLVCLQLADGRRVWGGNILEEYQGSNIQWGISESPLIDGNLLVCTPGGRRGTMVALNKETGRTEWTANVPGNPAAGYASPIAIDVNGERQYVNFTHAGIIGVRASDGEFLWANDSSANDTANCSTALFQNNHVFSASGYGTGGALVRLTGGRGRGGAELVYHTREMINHHGGMVLVDGYIYAADEGSMKCLNFMTGDVMWQSRSVGKGAVVYADGMIILRSESGPLALMEATPDEYRELGRFDQPQRSNRRAWAHPVVADGRLFLRDQEKLLVYNLRE